MASARHSFSIEMISKDHMNRISISNEPDGEVVFEGELGELTHIELIEGIMLQITGKNGILRIDITEVELTQGLAKRF
jgi:hypothetical protein